MTEDGWDFEHQRAETFWTVADLIKRGALKGGERIALDLEFVPDPEAGQPADRDALLRKLKMFGFHATEADPDAPDAVTVEVADVPFEAEAIWQHEETATKLALIHGYVPDGWGFWEP